jgi:hypothetical protein
VRERDGEHLKSETARQVPLRWCSHWRTTGSGTNDDGVEGHRDGQHDSDLLEGQGPVRVNLMKTTTTAAETTTRRDERTEPTMACAGSAPRLVALGGREDDVG